MAADPPGPVSHSSPLFCFSGSPFAVFLISFFLVCPRPAHAHRKQLLVLLTFCLRSDRGRLHLVLLSDTGAPPRTTRPQKSRTNLRGRLSSNSSSSFRFLSLLRPPPTYFDVVVISAGRPEALRDACLTPFIFPPLLPHPLPRGLTFQLAGWAGDSAVENSSERSWLPFTPLLTSTQPTVGDPFTFPHFRSAIPITACTQRNIASHLISAGPGIPCRLSAHTCSPFFLPTPDRFLHFPVKVAVPGRPRLDPLPSRFEFLYPPLLRGPHERR